MLILAILLILIYFSTKHQKTDGLLEKLDVVRHQEVKPVKEKKIKIKNKKGTAKGRLF